VFTTTNWAEHVYSEKNRSITTLDQGTTTLDDSTTSIDRVYTFTITASDALRYSEISRTFNLLVNTPNNANYSNIFAKPFLKVNQRQVFRDFITDPDIFNPKLIYRLSDGNFGLQKDLRMLVFGGIETKTAAEYISAIGMNHRTKRFKLGQIKKAVAKEPGTNNILYEVVYVEVLDPLEKNKQHLPFTIKGSPNKLNITVDSNNEFDLGPFNIDSPFWKRPMPLNVTLDRTDIFAGDPATQYRMPSSISIWRKRIRNMPNTARERNYLPLWMRSIQANSMVELDYVPAVPLCFCKPGTADDIILNIENSGFDFKLLDYTIDRYIIDSVEGDYTDKYLVFRNDRTTIT
jgi:hypothetical protein